MRMLMICIFLIFCLINNIFAKTTNTKMAETYLNNMEDLNIIPPKMLNHRPGDDVIMKCRDHEGTSNMHEHKWKFFKCDNCDDLIISQLHPSDWKILPGQKKRLHFKSITLTDSGRYVCSVNENIIASYQLKVSEPPNPHKRYKFIGRPPEIIAIEKSDHIHLNANVAVKCKIDSPLVPRIWWLKLCEAAQKCDLNYDSQYYYKINVTYQDMQLEENVYVSKLYLRNFTHRDDGLYVCVTMTELGKDYRNFTLALPPVDEDEDAPPTTGTGTGSSLNFLFLVPFVFILIPFCIDCVGKRIGVKKNKQEVVLLEVLPPSTSRV